jgi:hypothetical protein
MAGNKSVGLMIAGAGVLLLLVIGWFLPMLLQGVMTELGLGDAPITPQPMTPELQAAGEKHMAFCMGRVQEQFQQGHTEPPTASQSKALAAWEQVCRCQTQLFQQVMTPEELTLWADPASHTGPQRLPGDPVYDVIQKVMAHNDAKNRCFEPVGRAP